MNNADIAFNSLIISAMTLGATIEILEITKKTLEISEMNLEVTKRILALSEKRVDEGAIQNQLLQQILEEMRKNNDRNI